MTYDPRQPYNDLPPLPPPVDVETKAVLKRALSAGRAVAELKGLGQTIPNQVMLVTSLVLQEARASSEIENIVTTNDALFRAFTADTSRIDPATKEVLRYREALWAGYEALKTRPVLSTNLFVEIVQRIKQTQAGIRQLPGTAVANSATGEVIYTPPDGETVIRTKLKELEDFIHAADDIDPLIKLALIHYQFEAIHPFSDGNGRTGRIVNILYLFLMGLLDMPVLYLSKAIIERKNDYYRLLRAVTERGEWEPWVVFMLTVVEDTAVHTHQRIVAIRDLMRETMDMAKALLPSRVYSKELIELLFYQPYTKAQFVVDAGLARRQTAASYLKALETAGMLESHRVGKETLYLNVPLYDLLAG
ncbi:MAG: Fic family protein [Armatimonadetes bacterium]|nr:Fic family protein [Armatimonadota bacterium]